MNFLFSVWPLVIAFAVPLIAVALLSRRQKLPPAAAIPGAIPAPPPRKRLYLQVRCSGITHLWIWHVGDWDLLIASVVQRVIAGEMCRNCAGNFFIEILRLEVPDHAASFELAMRFARAMEQKMSDGSCAGK